jgi:lambda family phage tail tape measure protein
MGERAFVLELHERLERGRITAREQRGFGDAEEGAYPILQAAAAGIKETGGEVSKLTTLVKDGQVSSKAFFYGVLAGAPTLTEKLAGSTKTAAQAWTQLWNAVIKVSGEVDKVTGGTTGLVSALDGLTGSLDRNAKGMAEWAGELKSNVLGVLGPVADAIKTIHGYMLQLQTIGLDAAKDLPQDVIDAFPEFKAMGLKSRVDPVTGGGFGGEPEPDRGETRDRNRRAAYRRQFSGVKRVSLADYPAEGKKKDGAAAGDGEAEDEYERAIRRSREHVDALRVEAETVGKTTEEKARAAEAQRLLTAAKQADLEVTPAVRSEIDAQAAAFARATAEVERLEKAQHQATQAADDFRGATKDVLSGFLSDLRQGKSGAEALANALNKVADKVMDKLVSNLVDGLLGASGTASGGLFKSILGLFGFAHGGAFGAGGVQAFARGGAFTNSIVASPTLFKFANGTGLMGEAGPEAIMPLRRDRSGRLGVTAAGGAATATATGGGHTYAPTINMQLPTPSGDPGRDAAYADLMKRELRGMLDAHAAEFMRQQARPGGMMGGGLTA